MKINDFNSELELMKESDIRSEERVVSVTKKPITEKIEILERRESHSKTFQKKKGKFETIFYNVPVHHYDETEKVFVEMNEDVEENETGFETTKHDFAVIFHKQENSKALFTMKRGNYQVCVSVKDQFGNQTKRPMPIFEQDHNRMHYTNVSLDTDYDCSVTASGIKISMIKHSAQNTRSTFVINCDGLRYVWDENDNVLRFVSEETDETVFEIPAPFMIDASCVISENVSFEIVSVSNHLCELSVVPDMGWLSAKDRTYPVSLDWSMSSNEPVNNGFTFERKNITADGKVKISGKPVPFKMHLPKQKDGVITKRVKALFHCDSIPIAEDKNYLLVLNRVNASDTEAAPTSERIGVSMMSIGKTEYAFDVISEYTAGESTSYSLQLCEEQDGDLVAADDASVALMKVSTDSAVSTFSVEETDGSTEEDKSSGESGNIGSVGTYEVDLVSGKLNMEMKDFAWEGNRMPISISRSYKGQFATKNYGSWSNANGNFGSMLLGFGWRMNLMQSMVDTGTQKIGDVYKSTYTYTDEAGEETIFTQCECESGSATCTTYEDVAGLGYVYESATGVLTKGTEKHTFSSGRLVKIVDEFNNTMTINYTSGRISSVKDGVGRTFTFGYSGNYLVSITAPNGSSIQYQYQNGNLYCATYPNGQTLTFTYDTSANQPSEVTVSGNGIIALTTKFAYSNKIISEISTITNGTTVGKHTEFDIDSNGKQTIVTEIDDGEIDQIKQYKVYFHEHPDKNYTYYEAGSENKIAISGSNGVILPYTEPGLEIGNITCKNLLNNHNFNTGITNPTSFGWSTNLTGDYRDILYDMPEKMPGYCSAYLSSFHSKDREKGIWQTVDLSTNKPYVFSCYLKLVQDRSDPARGVYLMVKSANGSTTYRSQMITTKKNFQRVALPFMVDASCGSSYTVGIYIDGNVKAKAIAPQLEQGTTLSPYNYLAYNVTEKEVPGLICCPNPVHVANVKVPAAKDARETFTLSGYAKGAMTCSSSAEQETYAALKAVIHYQKTAEESKNGSEPQSNPFWVPIYTNSNNARFAMVQFSKDQYRAIDYIKITCENNYNSSSVTFSDLQLVRNTYVDGLTEEDFIGSAEDDMETDDTKESLLTSSYSDSDEDEMETITFEEVLDTFGNVLTGTNFKNGELGAIYTEQVFADSNPADAIGDEGNNKTKEIDARGKTTRYEYDPVTSKPTKVTDRCDNSTSYTYDAAGRTTQVTAPNGGTVSYGYNSYDDLTSITRGDEQNYTMKYDAYRNLTSVDVGSKNLVRYDYKSGGNRLKSMTYANGAVQGLTYDRFGNVIGEKWTNGTTTEAHYRYFYDASNQLVKTVDIGNNKLYNINRVGENVASVEEYDIASINTSTYTVSGLTLVGTMYYSFDSDGKQFRKKYVAADGTEQKYVFEYQDEQNVAIQLPTGVVSHSKSDHLGRKVFDELQLGKGLMNRKFTYHDGVISQAHLDNDKQVSTPETTLVKKIEFADGRTIEYAYDNEERITLVKDSVDGNTAYEYDSLGQLTQEIRNVDIDENGDITGGTPIEFTYDDYGNILTKNGKVYGYDNSNDNPWKDRLLSYEGQTITYDANGNPTNYLGHTLTWEKGRQLKKFDNIEYTYNANGIRTSKKVNGVLHTYTLDGTNIIKETWNGNTLIPLYDLDGTVCGLKYNGTAYYFYKNLQGDVIAITDDTGETVARYAYDAWGKITSISGLNIDIAHINPFRYRGYYYDEEIELYYLQSRYYDPAVGRFINADDVTLGSIIDSVLQSNLFVYCQNNPINEVDQNGTIPGIGTLIKKILKGLAIGFFRVFFVDLLEYAFSVIVLKRTNAEFKMSKEEDYAASMLNEIVAQFFDMDGIKDTMALIAIAAKYLTKIVRGRMAGQDWLNLLLELLALFLNNKLKKTKKNLESKRQQIIVQKKKKGSRNLIRKSQIQAQTRLTLKIRYKCIQIDFVLPLSFQFISSVLNIFVFA